MYIMKAYDSNKTYKSRWLTNQNYIPCSDALWGDTAKQIYNIVEKFPIAKIKYDKENYPNELKLSKIMYMYDNFYPFAFDPITIDENSELKDGQHRLELAKWFGWKFIDVFVEKNK